VRLRGRGLADISLAVNYKQDLFSIYLSDLLR
jgi:hypothetical protein